MPPLRLFIAIDPPPGTRALLGDTMGRLKAAHADICWEPAEKLHCTLKFLGDTSQHSVIGISDVIQLLAAETPAFEIACTIVGAFPHWRSPRVVWAGLEDRTEGLVKFQRRLDRSLASLGFTMDEHEFTPHITLGRAKTLRNIPVLLRNAENTTFPIEPLSVSSVQLMRSELTPHGSIYAELKKFPLVGKPQRYSYRE